MLSLGGVKYLRVRLLPTLGVGSGYECTANVLLGKIADTADGALWIQTTDRKSVMFLDDMCNVLIGGEIKLGSNTRT